MGANQSDTNLSSEYDKFYTQLVKIEEKTDIHFGKIQVYQENSVKITINIARISQKNILS
jgi:hypothetical protein